MQMRYTRARPRPDGRTESLFPFASTPSSLSSRASPFSFRLVPSVVSRTRTRLCRIHQVTIPSLFICLPFSLVYFCSFALSPSLLFPLSSINLPSFSLSLAPRYPTPTPLSFFYFSIFRISLSVFVFVSRRCRYYFYPPRPVASFVLRVSSTLSAQTVLLPPTFCFLYRMFVCGALLPAYSYAPSPFNIPALLQKAAPVSAFCDSSVADAGEGERRRARE